METCKGECDMNELRKAFLLAAKVEERRPELVCL